MPKLYTRTGDKGMTSLYDSSRKRKNDIIFDVLGDLDELSSNIGMLWVLCDNSNIIRNRLRTIQVKIMDMSSIIATPNSDGKILPIFDDTDIKQIESWIDDTDINNIRLTQFIVPGVHMSDAQCNICRSIVRRAERKYVSCSIRDVHISKYINRLSDYFFCLSRNLSSGEESTVRDIRINLNL